jgi:lysozyme
MDQHLLNSIKLHEGLRLEAYLDSEGVWTIGYGRNLQVLKITAGQAEKWLREDIETAHLEAERFPEWEYLNTVARRNVFVEMVFNLGASRLRGFGKMLEAIRSSDWAEAAVQMLDSKWARQVGYRAKSLSGVMESGSYGNN